MEEDIALSNTETDPVSGNIQSELESVPMYNCFKQHNIFWITATKSKWLNIIGIINIGPEWYTVHRKRDIVLLQHDIIRDM